MKSLKYILSFCIALLCVGLSHAQLHWYLDSANGSPGSQVVVPVRADDFTSLISMQGTVNFDPNVLGYVGVEQFALPGMGVGNFGTTQTNAGKLTFSWFDSDLSGETIADSGVIWAIRFDLVGSGGANSILKFGDVPTVLEFIHSSFSPVAATFSDGSVQIDGGSTAQLSIWIDSVQAYPNNVVEVPVRASDFAEITGLQGTIGWDPNIVSYVDVEEFGLPGMGASDFGTSFISSGKLTFAWADLSNSGQSIADSSILFTLKFFTLRTAGFNSAVWFDNTPTPIEIVDTSLNILNPLLENGFVDIIDPSPLAFQLYMDSLSVPTGTQVVVPIRANGWSQLINASGTVEFDPAVLSFVGIEQYGLTDLDIGDFDISGVSGGTLTFDWIDTDSSGESLVDASTVYAIRFDVIGGFGSESDVLYTGTNTVLEFENTSFEYVPAYYEMGYVEVLGGVPDSLTLCIDSASAYPNNVVFIPVRASDFANITGVQGTIGWNPNVASFADVVDFGLAGLDASDFGTAFISSGKLTFAWADLSNVGQTVADSAVLFTLKLFATGNAGASTNIWFENAPTPMEIVDTALKIYNPVLKIGHLAIIDPSPLTLQLYMDTLFAASGAQVLMPIRTNGWNNLINASGSIEFDPSILSYVGVEQFGLTDLDATDFDASNVGTGNLVFDWIDIDSSGESVADSTALWYIRFDVIGAFGSGSDVNFVGNPQVLEFIDASFENEYAYYEHGRVEVSSGLADSITLHIDSVSTFQNNVVNVPVRASDFINIMGIQGTIGWDPSIATFISVENFGLPGLDPADFGTSFVSGGNLTYAWADMALPGQTVADSTILFEIKFFVNGAPGTSTQLGFLGTPTPMEVVDSSLGILIPQLNGGLIEVLADTALPFALLIDSVVGMETQIVQVPVRAQSFEDILSMQATFQFDTSVITYYGVGNFNLPGMNITNFGTNFINQGLINFSWFDTDLSGENYADSTILFTLLFNVVGSPGDWSDIFLVNSPTPIEYTNTSFNQISFGLDSGGVLVDSLDAFIDITNGLNTSYCIGDSITVEFRGAVSPDPTNVYTLELSDATGDFTTFTSLATITSDADSGMITGFIPYIIPMGSGYRVRVSSSSPLIFQGDPNLTDLNLILYRDTVSTSICQGDSLMLGGSFQTLAGFYGDTLNAVDGCDSIVVTQLNIVNTIITNDSLSICNGDSLLLEGAYQFVTGTYHDTLMSAAGCDSVIITKLTVLPNSFFAATASICPGDSMLLEGMYQLTAGVYFDTLISANGCDSVLQTTLSLFVPDTTYDSIDICFGDSSFLGGSFQLLAGNYTDVLVNQDGCDSSIITTLTVLPDLSTTRNDTICNGDSLLAGGTYQKSSGTFLDTLIGASGCDSVVTTELTVLPVYFFPNTLSICSGDSALIFGSYQTAAGIYYDSLQSFFGCDSVYETTLIVNPVYSDTVVVSICAGDSLLINGAYQSTDGIYVDSLLSLSGCDSLVYRDLSVLTAIVTNVPITLCFGDSTFAEGAWQTTTGVYQDTIIAVGGCDSTIVTTVTVLPDLAITSYDTICSGATFFAGGMLQMTSGTYVDTLIGNFGCDSIVTTELTVLPTYLFEDTLEICSGDSALIFGVYQNMASIYYDSLLTDLGCDSVYETTLFVHPVYSDTTPQIICAGDSVFVGGLFRKTDGIYVDSLLTVSGCDSLVYTDLSVLTSVQTNLASTICYGDSLFLDNAWQTSAGIYRDTLIAAAGCDSIVETNLTFHPLDTSSTSMTICFGDSVQFSSVWQKTTGLYYDTLINQNGCDSIIATQLTVDGPYLDFDTLAICDGDSAQIGAFYYRTNGTYYDTLASSFGCDSVIQFLLIVHPIANTNLNVNLCEGDSLFAGGAWQFGTGIVTDTLIAITGCDSLVHTNITLIPTIRDTVTTFICSDGNLFLEGANQNTPGIYIDTFPASTSCDSIVITNLMWHAVPNTYDTLDLCNGDSILVGGAYQNMAGTYTDTLVSAVGCDSLHHRTLNFVNQVYAADTFSICGNDSVLLGGIWRNMSGIYTDSLLSSGGCDSIVTITLTVLPFYQIQDSITVCNGDSALIGGVYRTSSGLYYDTLLSALGCDSILETRLTVLPTYDQYQFLSICFGDSIFAQGNFQKIAGSYVDIYISAGGCDSMVTKVVTVLPLINTTNPVTICEGDSVFAGGAWQTTSGFYVDKYTSSFACDSFVATDLTVISTTYANDSIFLCDGDSILLGGVYVNSSGTYRDTIVNANGCDSVITYEVEKVEIDNTVTRSGSTLIAVDTPGATYQWYVCGVFSNGVLAGATNNTYTPTVSGNFLVEITLNGCTSESTCEGISFKDGIAEQLNLDNVKVYPNPAHDILVVESKDRMFDRIEIYDLLGKKVRSVDPTSARVSLDLSELAHGMYVLRVWQNDRFGTVKIEKR